MTDIFHVNMWINIAIVAAVCSREYHSDEEGFEQAVAIPSLCFAERKRTLRLSRVHNKFTCYAEAEQGRGTQASRGLHYHPPSPRP